MDAARLAAFDTLRAVQAQDAYANLVLPTLVRDRHLDVRDAAFATELAYGTLRMRGLYDAVLGVCVDRPLEDLDAALLDGLRLGAHQLLGMRVPAHAAVGETVALVRQRIGPGPGALANAVLRRMSGRDVQAWTAQVAPDRERDLVGHLAVAHSHPQWVVRAFREALAGRGVTTDAPDTELAALLTADNAAAGVSLVARPGLAEVGELLDAGAAAGRWSPYAARWTGGDPGQLIAVREGRAGVQDEGSQLVALALAQVPLRGSDDRWLDLCAGPGGKAALLGSLAAIRGARLVAVEPAAHRADLVRSSVAALGATVEVRTGDGRDVGAEEAGRYDRVLVDVPCTGLGALRRRPEARWRRVPGDLTTLGPLQRALLSSALDAARPGGVVAYVTCSPHLAETRFVVDDMLRRRADVRLLDAAATAAAVDVGSLGAGAGSTSRTVQLWPHRHGTDAMFLALLTRD